MLRWGIPHWMDVEDLIHAGWIGYVQGWNRADPSRGNPHNYAKSWARGAMRTEMEKWYGSGHRAGERIAMVAFDIRDVNPARQEPTEEEIQERSAQEDRADALLKDFLRQLPLKQRQAVYLRYIRNLTNREVAEIMGISISWAGVNILSGIKMLRQLIAGAKITLTEVQHEAHDPGSGSLRTGSCGSRIRRQAARHRAKRGGRRRTERRRRQQAIEARQKLAGQLPAMPSRNRFMPPRAVVDQAPNLCLKHGYGCRYLVPGYAQCISA